MSHSISRAGTGAIILMAIVFYLGLTAAYTTWVVKSEKAKLIAELDRDLLQAARSIPLMLEAGFFERAVQPGAISEKEDLRNIDQLTRLADALDMAYLYTLVEVDGTVYITSSSASEEERQNSTEVRAFTPYPEMEEDTLDVMAKGKLHFHTYTDRWGTFRHVYIPLRNPQGVPYVLAADHSSDYIAALLKRQVIQTVATPLFFLLAAIPFLVAYQMQVRKNSRDLRLLNRDLSENKERFELAAEAGGIGVWDRDIVNDRLVWDERMVELYGVRKEDFGGAYEAWQQCIHPDDLERATAEVTAAEQGEKPFDTEFRIVRPDGETRHMHAFGKVICHKAGKPIRMIGTNQDITERKALEAELLQFTWLLEKEKKSEQTSVLPEYDDVTTLNENGLILSTVGKPMLENMANDVMALLDTSMAVYEKNGDYAFGTFVSTWCGTMDNASRRLCRTDDNAEALACGKWCCHESCWAISKEAMDSGEAVDRECDGGLRIYAVPVRAGDEIIGVISIGYGTPPDDPQKLNELAEKYELPADTLRQAKQAYRPRPPFIIETAKQHLHSIAHLIGETVERRQKEEQLQESEGKLRDIIENSTNVFYSHTPEHVLTYLSPQIKDVLGYEVDEALVRWTELTAGAPEDEHALQLTEEAIRTGMPQPTYELQLLHKDGHPVWVEVREAPVVENGQTAAIVGSLTDITDAKTAEIALKQKMDELERFNKAAVGRELRMVELKKEINALCRELDRKGPYA